ncbi:glycine cleavage system H protein [Saccharopolyspora erythraea NRRL 2338]|uniref:Glycine cleavage system H protein n=2 Tax=Saccharopolyspora erythraea TaxID=1836 RepID=A4F718_SACEN|nr:glycine cleavage system protein GcvH [Saccharopolyspora erythraea]EQD82091.1 glycine cleavage system protein H [Saccharopolyspora erythraea D]PFG93643.1 glycine cleavage system H protein [Saccharopolyspora erythraea NRRL 2338]QRK90495.1 glycine cleavage system protein GcvH [Saccharopolyspora erythraea]CAL99842.1 glycine cleavage system H protein [Saccharopolyspora erythraea NRRL 2338]
MVNIPQGLKYTQDHEWVEARSGDTVRIGITDHAQRELGDIVFVEMPEVGRRVSGAEALGSVESVKAVAEFFAPLGGEVVEVNSQVSDEPELVNTDPYGDGWIVAIKVADRSELDSLMSAEQYGEFVAEANE